MPAGFGRPSSSSARGSSSSGIRLACGPWLSLTSTEAAPPSNAPATAALTSSVISRRARSCSGLPGWPCAGFTTPASKDDLKRTLVNTLRSLSKRPGRIRSSFGHRTFRYAA